MRVSEWVPVMAPPDLASRFLREVAAYVADSDGGLDPRLWEDANAADIREFMRQLNRDQARFMESLAFADPPRSTASHAQTMDKKVDDIAGLVGPINKRAKKLGWVSPIRSHSYFNGRSTERVLALDERLAQWVKGHAEVEPE